MKNTLISLLLGLGVVTSAAAVEGNAEAGKNKAAACAACHGTDGNSLVPMYPKLAGQSAKYIAKQLADFKAGASGQAGRMDPIMGGMVMALSEQDMADLGAFYESQAISAGNGSENDRGHKLYFGGDEAKGITACAGCHGANGKGMAAAGFPAVGSQNVDYLKGQVEKFRSGARANDLNGMMQAVARKLSDEDIAAVTQYMSTLK